MLFKYSGKYVNIYFNMKITFSSHQGDNKVPPSTYILTPFLQNLLYGIIILNR